MASKFLILIVKAAPSAACKHGMELKKDKNEKKEQKDIGCGKKEGKWNLPSKVSIVHHRWGICCGVQGETGESEMPV